ncbi:hypothetical protein [Acidovorax sp. LjRoot117]|uniref:hypothetical protein n=1 Tax=Acidovorax sp. LjRoot117 TaxID=3342255 RepID=UPI003ECC5D48
MKQRFESVSSLVSAAAIEPAMRCRVALVLAAFQDREGPDFPAPLSSQAEFVGLPPDQIRGHIETLAALGVLVVTVRPDSGSPAPLPSYRFNKARLRALAQQHGHTQDLFGDLPMPRMPFLATDVNDGARLMAMEFHGLPGQRTVHFFLEGARGDIPFGWGYLRMLLLPAFAKGAWTGALNPNEGAPAWARPVNTDPETMDELRQWAQVLALGRSESMSDPAPIRTHPQKQKGTADGH